MDLYKAVNENVGGIALLGDTEYKFMIEMLMSYIVALDNGNPHPSLVREEEKKQT